MRKLVLSLVLMTPGAVFAADDAQVVQHCQSVFGDDYTMVDYCRRQQLEAAAALDRLSAETGDGAEAATVITDCMADAAGDFHTALLCAEIVLKAEDAESRLASDVPADAAAHIRALCPPRAGPDNAAMTYCLKSQIRGYLAIAQSTVGLPEDVATRIRAECDRKAEGEYSNMAFCVAEQADAWRALQ